jgi:diketogulonate reductase-like aldo/keto reductase
MRTVELGPSGFQLPELGLGTYLYTGGAGPLGAGLDRGATLIDTAPLYLSEPVVAQALAGRRDEVVVATKVGGHQAGYQAVIAACDRSLKDLGIDWIDLYQLHWPNPDVPIAETVGALEDLVDAGKVRFLGCSNFSVPELRAAQEATTRHRFVSNQVQYSLMYRLAETSYNPNRLADPDEGDVLTYCRDHAVAVIAWGPLGMGRMLDPTNQRPGAETLRAVAREAGATPAQVALNWCTSGGGVVAIPKSDTAAHITENLGAASWRLSPDQVARLDTAFEKYRAAPAPPGRLCDYLTQWAHDVETSGQQQ